MSTVQVTVTGGPTIAVPWHPGMNAQKALEGAYNAVNDHSAFSFSVEYFGSSLGYLVVMLNGRYESLAPSDDPYYYWEFFVNDVASSKGIDSVTLHRHDVVTFTFEVFNADRHNTTTVGAKHALVMKKKKAPWLE